MEKRLPNHINVIPLHSSWSFFDYIEGSNNPIEGWHQGLSEEGQDIFEGVLKANSKAHLPIEWNDCKMLQGEAKEFGIWEWRFFADEVQQRLLGVFGRKRKEAIFLVGCFHKQKRYYPPDAIATAIRRAKVVIKGEATLNARPIEENI